MNLLVTGGAGFIGSNLIRQIIDRPEIDLLFNLDCLTYAGNLENLRDVEGNENYRFEQIDIRDKDAVRKVFDKHGITHVIHLAAESHVDRSIVGPDDFIHTNVLGTFHLLEACRDAWRDALPDRRLLHVSTDEVYGSLGPEGLFTESTPHAPNSPYSASKSASDMLVRAYFHTYGLPAVTTNCSNNYGPFQYPEKLIPVVIQSVLERREIPVYGDGGNVRDWLYVEDHADALLLCLKKGENGRSYNIGGENERTNLQLVRTICGILDRLRSRDTGTYADLITFVTDRPGHDARYAIDPSRMREELGWRPSVTLEQGLRRTVAWYLENEPWWRALQDRKGVGERLGTGSKQG